MKIGVIGTGHIGGTLGKAWAAAGHDVVFGVRDPDRASGSGLPGQVNTIVEAVRFGDAILFAIPGSAMLETIRTLDLSGKIVLDATNFGGTAGKPLVQAIAEMHPKAYVYKAFNTLGFENFQNPRFGEDRADLLFIGPDAQQKTVSGLIMDVGLNPVYVGGLDQTAAIDAALALWFALSPRFGRHLAFRVLHNA